MNFDELKHFKFDPESLKNFSIEDLRDFINDRQTLALNIVIALASFIVASVLFNAKFQEYTVLKERLRVLEAKEEPVVRYEKGLKKNKEFLAAVLPPLTEDSMIPYVTEIATRRHVLIDSFEAPRSEQNGFYREVNVVLTCSARSFQDAMLFVHDIERSGYWVSVGSFVLRAQKPVGDSGNVPGSSGVTVSIGVSSIELMENAQKNRKKQ